MENQSHAKSYLVQLKAEPQRNGDLELKKKERNEAVILMLIELCPLLSLEVLSIGGFNRRDRVESLQLPVLLYPHLALGATACT